MKKQTKIKTNKRGWLTEVFCEQNHDGINLLSKDGAEHYICAGCGTYYHYTEVVAAINNGENSQGTLSGPPTPK